MFQIETKNNQFSKPEISEAGEIVLKYKSPNIIYVNKFTIYLNNYFKDLLENVNKNSKGNETVVKVKVAEEEFTTKG